jgi:diguanylate cyclase (GGDEF)-like protein/PAS domain S-box-containing protein
MSEALFQSDKLFRTLLDNLHEGVYFTDTQRHIRYWNKGAERISGFSMDEVLGRCCSDNILMHTDLDGKPLCYGVCPLAATMADGEHRTAKVFLHHKQGHRVPVLTTTAAITDDTGRIVGGLETFHDVASEMSALSQVEELRTQSLLCPLTGIGNRRYAEQMLAAKFEEVKRNSTTLGVVFIDIDHFKSINDRFGHRVGDVALKMVARTLSNALRSYDFLGRWGGEEFLCLLPNVQQPQLEICTERLRALVQKSSTEVSERNLVVTISLGAVVASENDDLEQIVQRADDLMYQSKQQGRNRVTLG